MDIERIKNQLKSDEGYSRFVYQDTRGYWTIGYGLCVQEGIGEGMSELVADYALTMSVNMRIESIRKSIDFFDTLPPDAQFVLANMSYKLGVPGLCEFHQFLSDLKTGQYAVASVDMLKSLWARQTPDRAQRLSNIVKAIKS